MPEAPASALGKGGMPGHRFKLFEPVPAWRTQAANRLWGPVGGG